MLLFHTEPCRATHRGTANCVCHCTVYVFLYVCMIENRKQKEDVGDNGEKTEAIANK